MLKKARGSQYGSSQTTSAETGSVNRSFPLTEEELRGLGDGPMSLRVDGEHKKGTFGIHRVAKLENENDEQTRAVDVRSSSEISPG